MVPIPKPKHGAWQLFRRLLPTMRPHMHHAWIMLACLLLGTPLAIASPRIVMHIIDHASRGGTQEDLLPWTLLLFGMTLASVLLGIVIGWNSTLFQSRVLLRMRLSLFRHLQRLSLGYHQQRETGWLMARQQDDVQNLRGVMADTLVQVSVEALKAFAFLGMLVWVEWRLALGGGLLIAVVFALQWCIAGPLRTRTRTVQEASARFTETLHQGISGHALVLATASESREARRFVGALHGLVRATLRKDLFALFTNHVVFLIAGVAPTLIILGGAWMIAQDELTVGGLFAFFMYLVQLFASVSEVARVNPAIQSSLVSLERIYEILDTEPEVRSPTSGRRLEPLRGDVRFESVGFAYEPNRPVLREVTFTVAPNTVVAIVGPSGAGKTTLAHLVPRFSDPDTGRITLDGHDLRALDLTWLRQHVGVVPQDVFLFDRSVRENIGFGVQHSLGDVDIWRALEAACAREFVEELPMDLSTPIGERGVRLSMGQRQRLAIARELLRDPKILILDEATSNLDARSEAMIQTALERLRKDRTCFVIAHRLSTVLSADVILVLDEGRVVEEGTHTELLAKGQLYAHLFHTQLGQRKPQGDAPLE